ncbi:MAG: tRNA 2-thiouridine(34) synthase MnmA, partial [Chloroflexota bacterium]
MLAEQGRDVVGITMRVVAEHEHRSVFQPCCSAEMAKDARQVADQFGFPHYTLNLVENFERQVIDDFAGEYASGRTPNPCVRCNQRLKFGTLYKKALEFGAEFIATGHYVRLARVGARYAVRRAVHRPKDQSYVMAGLSQKQLAMGVFPLGEMTKEQTREKARALGLAAAETPES